MSVRRPRCSTGTRPWRISSHSRLLPMPSSYGGPAGRLLFSHQPSLSRFLRQEWETRLLWRLDSPVAWRRPALS
jgi:hypothetical protein